MNPEEFPLALFAFLGFVAAVPVWMFFFQAHATGLPTEVQFLAGLVLPASVGFFLASWVSPGGA